MPALSPAERQRQRRFARAPDDLSSRQRLKEMLARGDGIAAEAVLEVLPRPLPARLPAALRDGVIVAVAEWLAQGWPRLSRRLLAEIIQEAGDALERGGQPRSHSSVMALAPADRAELLARLAPAVGWGIWPGTERIRRLVRQDQQRRADLAKVASGAQMTRETPH